MLSISVCGFNTSYSVCVGVCLHVSGWTCVDVFHLSQPRGMLLGPSAVCCLQPDNETLNMSLLKRYKTSIISCRLRMNTSYS